MVHIAWYGQLHWPALREPLGLVRDDAPHATTISRTLAGVSVLRAITAGVRENWYLLTGLPPERCRPDRLLRLFRNHWSIENSLHHVKDRSWDEDRHTLRRPGLGEVFATLVNASLNLLRQDGWFPESRSMTLRAKTCAFQPELTVSRPFGPPSY